MAFNGVRLFRYCLLSESAMNVASAIPILMSPEYFLSFLLTGPNQVTPATCSLMRIFGGIVLGLTAPLLISYPNDPSEAQRVAGARHMAYTTLGACEATMGAVAAMLWVQGDSGFKDTALLGIMSAMGVFLGGRVFFLFARPSWMEAQTNAKKAF